MEWGESLFYSCSKLGTIQNETIRKTQIEGYACQIFQGCFIYSFNLGIIPFDNGPKVAATVASNIWRFLQQASFAQSLKLIVHDFLDKHQAIKSMNAEEESILYQKSKALVTLLLLQLITPSAKPAEAKRLVYTRSVYTTVKDT